MDRLGINRTLANLVELGCGYGTFSLPVARRISGTLATFDIEDLAFCRQSLRFHTDTSPRNDHACFGINHMAQSNRRVVMRTRH